MARILQLEQEQERLEPTTDEEQVGDLDQFEVTEKATSKDAEPQEEDQMPEKYQGKSVQEIVRMHQEAEKALGRQSSEVGDLRKVVDTYIQTQLSSTSNTASTTKADEDENEEDIDFFSDPDKAVNRAIANHPSIKEANARNEQYRKSNALETLTKKHPDMGDILQDEAFGEWIQGSKIRSNLFVLADKQYDYDAADELFSLWKDRKQLVQNTTDVEKKQRQKVVKSASTGSASGNADGASSKKIYRRADIINLMKTNPERYAALADEITKAYAEKRVK